MLWSRPCAVFRRKSVMLNPGSISSPKGLFAESLSWDECETALKTLDTVLIPIGAGLKEHAHHLPLNNDALLAQKLTERVIERSAVLALPVIAYGYYPAFVEYPGSVSLREETFRMTLEDVARSWMRHGVKKFYFLNTGISTLRALESVRELLGKEGVRVAFTDFRKDGASAAHDIQEQPRGTHADEIETSMMLHLAPECVRMSRARPELALDRAGGLTRNPNAPSGTYSLTGAWGDPTLATAAKGERVVAALVKDIVRSLEELQRGT